MPRARAENITHAGSDTVIVDVTSRDKLVSSLVKNGFNSDGTTRFVKAANGIAVHAYELEDQLSTRGSLILWYEDALNAVEHRNLRRIRELLADSEDEFEGRIDLESQLLAVTGGLPAALHALKVHCEIEMARLTEGERRTRRGRSARQILADELVYEWYVQFGDYPKYWIEDKWPPFPAFLKEVLHLAERHYFRELPINERDMVTEDGVHGLVKRAIDASRRRIKRESQNIDQFDRSD